MRGCGLAWGCVGKEGFAAFETLAAAMCLPKFCCRRFPCSPPAGHIFAAQLQPPEEALEKGLKPGTVLNAAGEHPISAAEAAEAAVAAYRLALEAVEALSAQAGAAADATTWRKAVCRLLQHACSVRQQQLAQAGQGDAHRRAEAALAACLEQAVARGCTAADGKAAAAGWRRSAARSVPAASDARDEL